MPRRSRPSGRPSTTSRRTSSSRENTVAALGRLIDELPAARTEEAFAHPYWVASRVLSYERLEFLGDSVLDIVIAKHLYLAYPAFSEGQMTKVLAHVRSRAACAAVASELELGRRLLAHARSIGAEEAESLSANTNVQGAVVEAVLGALFLEHGLDAIAPAVVAAFSTQIDFALTQSFDAKTELMELLGKDGKVAVYRVLEASGPPHNRTFVCAVLIDGEQAGAGEGKKKKDAEQAAAREALVSLGHGVRASL